ncbi:right-handed parallel beta-helix repeat-containing protein [Candidatus Dependentiae bacterium]|nr:right-handed parallel beta-helix repeat-containing protein [Candidatus Dependentiae bacterium]
MSGSTDYNPFYTYYDYVYEANLYSSSAIGQSLEITRIEWASQGTNTLSNIKVYLKNISTSSVPAQNWSTITSGATLVYNGSMSATAGAWSGVNLTTTFNYDNSYNLLVLTEMISGSGGGSYYYTTSTGCHGRLFANASPPSGTFGASSDRANLQITGNPLPPSAPTSNAATSSTTTSFSANWSAVGGATGYYLDVSTVNNFASFVTGYSNLNVGNVTTYSVTGLSAGTTYYYRVRAYNANGTSSSSSTITAYTIPATPTISPATNTAGTSFTANWNTSTGASSYRLDVSTANDFSSFVTGYNNLDVGNVTSYSVTGLTSGIIYYYRVRAYNTGGTSSNSSSQNLLTLPAAPTVNAAGAITNSSFSANWNAVTSATAYRLDVATDAGFTSYVTGYQDLNVGNLTTYSVTGLTAGTTYYYRVRAVNATGTSANSSSQTVSIISNAPTVNSATNVNTSSFTANWNASTGASSYKLDVSTSNDFSSFVTGYNNLDVGNVTNYSITGLTPYTIYYYRVRAYNAGGTSSNSNTVSDTSLYNGPIFYVNDLSLTNDTYTSRTGSDIINMGNQLYPFRTITQALSRTYSGCTIYVDAGTYAETVVINTNNISILGVDSTATIIDPSGDSTLTALYGIYANGLTNLRICGLRIFDCYQGLYFNNIDTSIVENVWSEYCGNGGGYGFYIVNGSCSNTINNCYSLKNYKGMYLNNSSYNLLKDNTVCSSVSYGINLQNYSSYNLLLSNTALYNSRSFYFEVNSDTNILTGNTAKYSNGQGFNFENVKGYTVTGNTAISNIGPGFYVNGSLYNTLTGNTSTLNTTFGFDVRDGSANILNGNISYNNLQYGVYLKTEVNSKFSNNKSDSNVQYGLYMEQNANNNIFTGNTINSNLQHGIYVASSSNNKFEQNDIKNNIQYQIYLTGTSLADTFTKNNIQTSMTNQNYGLYNDAASNFDFRNNYWNTADSSVISAKINIISGTIFQAPYRTSEIDTAIGADTISPSSPTFINADTSVLKRVTLKWTKPVIDEGNTALTGLAGYRLYRVKNAECRINGDTDNWEQFLIFTIENADDTEYVDTGFNSSGIYYYKIIAYDSHITNGQLFYNRSWYSQNLYAYVRYNSTPETPVLLTPVDLPAPYTDFTNYGRTLNPRLNLMWQCPFDSDSNTLHFSVYIDSGSGVKLLANSAADTSGFYYYKNGSYETFTISGADSSVYGNTVYYKPQVNLNDSVYAWSIAAYDSDLYSDTSLARHFKIGGRVWSDTPLVSGQTLIRKIHIDELREEINYVRKLRGLSAFSWTDPVITADQTLIRKIHIDELRSASAQAANAANSQTPVWTDSSLTAGESIIRKIHFDELRQKIPQF